MSSCPTLLAATAALVLGGCMLGPTAPPQSTVGPSPAVSVPRGPTGNWWRLYREPALDALVAEALTNNRELHAAAAALIEARAMLGERRSDRLPRTGVSAGAGYGRTPDDQLEGAFRDDHEVRTGQRYGTGIDVGWEVDLLGRLRSAERAAAADAQAVEAMQDGVRVLVAADTVRAWLDACSFAHRAMVARRSLGLAEQGRGIAAKLAAAGAGAPLDVARAAALVEQARAAIPPLEAGRRRALAALAVLTGHPPAAVPVAAAACTGIAHLPEALPVGDGAVLLRRRPDVRAAEQRLAAASARIGVATADLFPRVVLGANVAGSAHDVGGLGAGRNIVWRLGPLISWSFPNIAAARARIGQARARERGALARFDSAILGALEEVERALADYDAALARRTALTAAAARSGEALRLARLGRMAGAASALELLDAERAAVAAEADAAAADADVATAGVALAKALGGGWEDAPPIVLPPIDRQRPTSSHISSGAMP